jgi:hypothetical protein
MVPAVAHSRRENAAPNLQGRWQQHARRSDQTDTAVTGDVLEINDSAVEPASEQGSSGSAGLRMNVMPHVVSANLE